MRRVGVSSASGSGKNASRSSAPSSVVRPVSRPNSAFQRRADDARQLEVLDLILADRNLVGAIEQNVRRLQHRVVQYPRVHALLPLRLFLELRLALELSERRDRVENPGQLGMFRNLRLHEQRGRARIDSRREQTDRHLAPTLAQLHGLVLQP